MVLHYTYRREKHKLGGFFQNNELPVTFQDYGSDLGPDLLCVSHSHWIPRSQLKQNESSAHPLTPTGHRSVVAFTGPKDSQLLCLRARISRAGEVQMACWRVLHCLFSIDTMSLGDMAL